VVEGETGVFFHEASAAALADALRALQPERFNPHQLVAHAAQFSPDRFRARLATLIQQYLA
jgi:hypothetical protein